eukprot:GHVH01012126.1.p1 GENE.GHVH01012126.1~~GHVH01012126.1.p1  ORF type:complete len:218 (+),score=29.90 GHVH01012126.1:70-654(+)
MPIVLPPLPYALDALSPALSKECLEFHYGKHHAAYVNKLNALTENSEENNKPVEWFFTNSTGVKLNQAAQIWNHTFYWQSMRPVSGDNIPTGKIAEMINTNFGSFDKFKTEFNAAAAGHFGSGWAWLVLKADGKLSVEQSHDAMNPIIEGTGKPLIACDVWEHAYYIDYRNSRPEYLNNFWKLVNWKFAEDNLQ